MRRLLLIVGVVGLLAAPAAVGAFPGGNGKIAFTSNEDDLFPHSLLTIEPDGSDRTKIVEGADHPAWSPDGKKIAFTAESFASTQIAIVNGDGTGRMTLTSTAASKGEPAWSPDGTQIAFTQHVPEAGPFGTFEIFVMNADGTGQRRITDTRADGSSLHSTAPAWSPDGGKIAFVRTVTHAGSPGSDEEIYVMNADGTGLVRLTQNPSGVDGSPGWSPDGSRILFTSDRDGQYGVYEMNLDGTGANLVFSAPPAIHPAWSPDGSRIAFASSLDIFTIRVDGSDPRNLTETRGFSELSPDWQPVNRDPDCSGVTATPASLGPPNHRLVPVTLTGTTDFDGDALNTEIFGVTQDEPVGATPDAVATALSHRVRLRAERDPKGDGRVYRIAFEVRDSRSGTCTGFTTVSVRKGNRAIDSAPPSHDSFGP